MAFYARYRLVIVSYQCSFFNDQKDLNCQVFKLFLKKSIINLELCILHLRIKNLQVEFTIHPLCKKYGNQHPLADEIRTTGSGKQLTPSPTLPFPSKREQDWKFPSAFKENSNTS